MVPVPSEPYRTVVNDVEEDEDDWLMSSGDEAEATAVHGDETAISLDDLDSPPSSFMHQSQQQQQQLRQQRQSMRDQSAAPVNARAPLRVRQLTMGERDLNKTEAQFEDAGYREGITDGKLSSLQAGFDEGFSTVGAPLGRAVGRLRGEATSLLAFVGRMASDAQVHEHTNTVAKAVVTSGSDDEAAGEQHIEVQYEDGDAGATGAIFAKASSAATTNGMLSSSDSQASDVFAKEDLLPGPGRARVRLKTKMIPHRRSSNAENGPLPNSTTLEQGGGMTKAHDEHPRSLSRPQLSPSAILALLQEAQSLLQDVQALTLEKLAPPDEEALAHEYEHALESARDGMYGAVMEKIGEWKRETEEERRRREAILPALYARLRAAKAVIGLA
ncbi:hypothetical protein OC846_002058 [Tilletia horrida]|uniref:Protein YAE1 n=1 Tax=Tilletia horrida TaxID=155126 RepID=A0AAN6GUX4_9BASI|nr:hypothetical protein OC846_002058 [Tilletia horrida]KAK0568270.1 hypothetical protein OC861_002134 [Tilletia horrida]